MPPSDQEPRYQLVDSNGNVVGSLFGDGSGNVVIADETDTQTTFDANGITTPALEATDIITGLNENTTKTLVDSTLTSKEFESGLEGQNTTVAASAETDIYKGNRNFVALVGGRTSNGNRFTELLLGRQNDVKVIATIADPNVPSRNYNTTNTGNLLLTISDKSNVTVLALETNPKRP